MNKMIETLFIIGMLTVLLTSLVSATKSNETLQTIGSENTDTTDVLADIQSDDGDPTDLEPGYYRVGNDLMGHWANFSNHSGTINSVTLNVQWATDNGGYGCSGGNNLLEFRNDYENLGWGGLVSIVPSNTEADSESSASQNLFLPVFIANTLTDTCNGGVFAIDLDDDDDIDLINTHSIDDDVSWQENDGSESFTHHAVDDSLDGAENTFAIDLDNDTDIDILASSRSPSVDVVWYENDGSEGFTYHLIDDETPSGNYAIYAIDLDGDDDNDVISIPSGILAWYENNGTGSFTRHDIAPGRYTIHLFAIDLDEDNDNDIITAESWYENNGSGSFTQHNLSTEPFRYYADAVDVDSDNDIDIITSGFYGMRWYENDGSESFTEHNITSSDLGQVYGIDLDNDNDIDIVQWNYWWENDGSESFTYHYYAGAGNEIYPIDIDDDGDIDIAGSITVGAVPVWYEQTKIDTWEEIIDLDIRFQNCDTGGPDHMWFDYIFLEVDYTVGVENNDPTIDYVYPIPEVSLTEASATNVYIAYNVTDLDGVSNLDNSQAKAYFTKSGETDRTNTTGNCATSDSGNTRTYNCSVEMQFYDASGSWNINVTAKDTGGSPLITNATETFTVSILDAVNISKSALSCSLGIGLDQYCDYLTLTNRGNQDYTTISEKSYDLDDDTTSTYFIYASNFTMNITNVSTGNSLQNNTAIAITDATLPKGASSTEDLYLWVDIGSNLAFDSYGSIQDWIIGTS